MQHPKRILVCPLDWGLGHAARCIPIINEILGKGAEVLIAADGRPLELLKKEFPSLTFIQFKGYPVTYPASGSMILRMLLSIPAILKGIRQEHKELKKIVDLHAIDIVISDNRYGCWNAKTKNIFITHQLMIKAPFGESLLHNIVLSCIKKYHECWIPDNDGILNLSGDLSHKYKIPLNTFFIGTLSRFKLLKASSKEKKYDLLVIISGPEPQRSIFEKLITEQVIAGKFKTLIIKGKPEENVTEQIGDHILTVSHLSSPEMMDAMLSSELLISRSGYSSVMDLSALNKKAIFVPTPGQTEQEYLAEYFMQKKIAYSQSQSSFNLKSAIKESKKYSGFNFEVNSGLEKRIELMLS